MVVAALELHLKLPAHSLKEKRSLLRGPIAKVRRDFCVSIAEVADLDLWSDATLGASCVSNDAVLARHVLQQVEQQFNDLAEVDVIQSGIEVFHW